MHPKDILKQLIADRFGGTQAAFARAINRGPAQVNQWLTGHRKLDVKGQRHIENALNLPAGFMSGADIGTISSANHRQTTHDRPLVQRVCDLAENINDDGLNQLVGFARCLLSDYPLTKAKPKSFA